MTATYTLGLDIGTTTVSAVVVDMSAGKVAACCTRKTHADIPSAEPGEKIQESSILLGLAMDILEEMLERYSGIKSIGITGQMHGIVYLDKEGNCVSPLYTWQDQRSAALCPKLHALTGYRLAPGYGLATHCALMETGAVPHGAQKLCTIMDYLAFLLCGKENLRMHASNAASLGFFDLSTGDFDREAMKKAGIDPEFMPPVTRKTEIQGYFRNIPVAVSIGDNQASFLGSVSRPETMALVNFGTGSQISRMVPYLPEDWDRGQVEVRPYLEDSYLLCGSALCGGRAYALLERFFRQFLNSCGQTEEDCYRVLNDLALEGMDQTEDLLVETTFCGTRRDPDKRGSITNLGEDNFTPKALAAGTLLGMARELWQQLRQMPGDPVQGLIASGNAVRKNPALLEAVTRVFGVAAGVPDHQEEAAFGAARFSAEACGCSFRG